MAKHDQRILKFLNQNADRAPTITEMMTRLNISISDISASLSSLLAQGLIAKKTNSQGIECWFPSSGAAVADVREKAPPPPPPPAALAQESASAISAQTQVLVERPPLERPMERLAERAVETAVERSPEPAPMGAMAQPVFQPMMSLAPPAKGIGFITLLFGMAVAVCASLYVGNRLVQKTIDASILKASKGLVDQKAFGEAINSWADFESRMQAQNKALESQVQALKDTLAAIKAADSMLVAGGDSKKKSEPAKAAARRRAAR